MTSVAPSPHVYKAINAITAAFARDGIPKSHTNLRDQYHYRSIDDLLNRLGPLLARHRLCILPRVLERTATEQRDEAGHLLTAVCVRLTYELISCRDGSTHVVEAVGEALDPGDKATAKALSAAYKSAMLQSFCIPVTGDDPDASTHRLTTPAREVEPVQGWSTWSEDIIDMIRCCESAEALDRVRTRHRNPLASLKREQPDQYQRIGNAFAQRGEQLARPTASPKRTAEPVIASPKLNRASKPKTKSARPVEPVDA